MSLLYTKLALGVEWSGEALNLVVLGRRFRQFVVVDWLRLTEPRGEEARRHVAEFLDRNRIREARVTVCLPRAALIVRFLDLPAEAESQLSKVIGYQIDALHPFQGEQVCWDFTVVARNPKAGQIQVMVVLGEKSRLDKCEQILTNLGLRVDSLTLAGPCLTPLLGTVVPEAAVVVCGRDDEVELIGLHQGNLCASRELPAEPREDAAERFERQLHGVRAALPHPDPTALPLFACGSVPSIFSERTSKAASLPPLKLRLALPPGFDLQAQLPALAAAYSGLQRKPRLSINLLPPVERIRPTRWARVPLYALGATAALLALVTAAHGWIENEFYARALERQIKGFESRAAEARKRGQQESVLAARAALLEGVRAQTWRKLYLLKELTRLMPEGTWLQEVQLDEGTAEIYGYSHRAADLVQPLENSAYFSQVEFTSPITRDAQNKEIFRIRMRLEQSARP